MGEREDNWQRAIHSEPFPEQAGQMLRESQAPWHISAFELGIVGVRAQKGSQLVLFVCGCRARHKGFAWLAHMPCTLSHGELWAT